MILNVVLQMDTKLAAFSSDIAQFMICTIGRIRSGLF